MKANTWIDDSNDPQINFYLDEADDFIIERNTTRDILIQLFSYQFPGQNSLQLLELGCGNGYISSAIFAAFPDNHFTLLDGSQQMINQAKKVFKSDKVRFVKDSIENYFSRQEPADRYDFIYSSNAIHHLSYQEKCDLYQYIYTHLNGGGLFVNIDVVMPPSERCEQWSFKLWQNWMKQKQRAKQSDNPAKYDGLPGIYKNKEENQPGTLDAQLDSLRKIGFRNVDCYYKYGIFALFAGTK